MDIHSHFRKHAVGDFYIGVVQVPGLSGAGSRSKWRRPLGPSTGEGLGVHGVPIFAGPSTGEALGVHGVPVFVGPSTGEALGVLGVPIFAGPSTEGALGVLGDRPFSIIGFFRIFA